MNVANAARYYGWLANPVIYTHLFIVAVAIYINALVLALVELQRRLFAHFEDFEQRSALFWATIICMVVFDADAIAAKVVDILKLANHPELNTPYLILYDAALGLAVLSVVLGVCYVFIPVVQLNNRRQDRNDTRGLAVAIWYIGLVICFLIAWAALFISWNFQQKLDPNSIRKDAGDYLIRMLLLIAYAVPPPKPILQLIQHGIFSIRRSELNSTHLFSSRSRRQEANSSRVSTAFERSQDRSRDQERSLILSSITMDTQTFTNIVEMTPTHTHYNFRILNISLTLAVVFERPSRDSTGEGDVDEIEDVDNVEDVDDVEDDVVGRSEAARASGKLGDDEDGERLGGMSSMSEDISNRSVLHSPKPVGDHPNYHDEGNKAEPGRFCWIRSQILVKSGIEDEDGHYENEDELAKVFMCFDGQGPLARDECFECTRAGVKEGFGKLTLETLKKENFNLKLQLYHSSAECAPTRQDDSELLEEVQRLRAIINHQDSRMKRSHTRPFERIMSMESAEEEEDYKEYEIYEDRAVESEDDMEAALFEQIEPGSIADKHFHSMTSGDLYACDTDNSDDMHLQGMYDAFARSFSPLHSAYDPICNVSPRSFPSTASTCPDIASDIDEVLMNEHETARMDYGRYHDLGIQFSPDSHHEPCVEEFEAISLRRRRRKRVHMDGNEADTEYDGHRIRRMVQRHYASCPCILAHLARVEPTTMQVQVSDTDNEETTSVRTYLDLPAKPQIAVGELSAILARLSAQQSALARLASLRQCLEGKIDLYLQSLSSMRFSSTQFPPLIACIILAIGGVNLTLNERLNEYLASAKEDLDLALDVVTFADILESGHGDDELCDTLDTWAGYVAWYAIVSIVGVYSDGDVCVGC
ncbi:hypothetical protein BZG36_00412 [Bifiguratus adelaidae]|uniref:Uncharacterized protein n=1 Tax=Bifiguratus adelaidae TaxID=1938954 RepID=A0A261Y808_9FUNG|nr:hypothetical protein BZG36_00412 [Bifiguratus adelaidae]